MTHTGEAIYTCGACDSLVTAQLVVVEVSTDGPCPGGCTVDFSWHAGHADSE